MKEQHKHKFLKINYNGRNAKYSVFRCVLPGCVFSRHSILCFGYIVICWKCGEEFVMTRQNCLQKKPHCKNCTRISHLDTTDRDLKNLDESYHLSKVFTP